MLATKLSRTLAVSRRTVPILRSRLLSGKPDSSKVSHFAANRGPVSWPSLFLVAVTAASAVAYFQVERERRLEQAMGKIVSSESKGWTPRPDYLAKRKFVPTKFGWFPQKDGFGARECSADCNKLIEGTPLFLTLLLSSHF